MSTNNTNPLIQFLVLLFFLSVLISITKIIDVNVLRILLIFLFIFVSISRLLFYKLINNRRFKGDYILNKQRSYFHLALLVLVIILLPYIDYSYAIAFSIAVLLDLVIIHAIKPQVLVLRNNVLIYNYAIIPSKYPVRALTTIKKNNSNSKVKLIFENKYKLRINTRDLDQVEVNIFINLLIEKTNPKIEKHYFWEI